MRFGHTGPIVAFNRNALTKNSNTDTTDTDGHDGLLLHGETTGSIIIGASYRVHSRLGPGLPERVYKTCVGYELSRLGISHESEKILPVEYDGLRFEFGYRVDLLVADAVIVEVKAVEAVLPVHEAQLLAYMRLSRKRVGLLINFNVADLKDGIRRRVWG
jgi:GxxExxY protein